MTTSIQSSTPSAATLSNRGKVNAAMIDEKMKRMLKVFSNLYDPQTNPQGIVSFGVADNSLMRPELLQYFNHNRLSLHPGELTYGDRIFTSARLLDALCHLFNQVPDGIPNGIPSKELPYGGKGPENILKVEPEHLVVGTGASGVLDGLFYSLCDEGDAILLSTPYYNGFDGDSGIRSRAKIVEVQIPPPEVNGSQRHFERDTLRFYEDAIQKAKKDGINVKVLLVCNPHNPTGGIYPRSTLIEFCKFASKHSLHLIMDEIYARSIFTSPDVANPSTFHSILTIDVLKEANLNPSNVSVVTSASKDFSVNGFRLGVGVIQHNEELKRSMTSLGILSQSSSPAGALWYTLLNDTEFLAWYLKENRRRLSKSYQYVTEWFQHFQIPYVPSTSGHFFLCDLTEFLKGKEDQKSAESELVDSFLENKVFLAPGAQYHHPIPGWFRFTFTTSPKSIQVGLERVEKTLGLKPFSKEREMLDLEKGMEKCPIDYGREKDGKDHVRNDDLGLNNPFVGIDEVDQEKESKSWEEKSQDVQELQKGVGNEKKSLLKRLTCGIF